MIVLSWNNRSAVIDCIARCLTLTGAQVHVVVVDNASADDSVAAITAAFPDVTVLRQATNSGFAGGVNRGLAEADRRGADFAWLVNDDTRFASDVLEPLLAHAEVDARCGLLSPRLADLEEQGAGPQFVNGLVDWDRARMGHNFPNHVYRARIAVGATPILAGTALLCDLRVYRSIGPLDERFFAYWEDTDYAVRAARAGYTVAVVPSTTVSHAAPFTPLRPPHYHYYMTRNEALFWRLHAPQSRWRQRWLSAALDAIGRERDLDHRANVVAVIDGLWHVWKKRYGPRDLGAPAPRWLRGVLSTSPLLLSRLVQRLPGRIAHRLLGKV